MSTGEAMFLGFLSGVVIFLVEHFWVHASWGLSSIIGVGVAVGSTALNVWLESRRRSKFAAEVKEAWRSRRR